MMKINTKIKVVFCLLLTFLMISKISVNASSDNIETKQYLEFDSNAVYFYDDNRSLSELPYTTSTVYTPNGSGVNVKTYLLDFPDEEINYHVNFLYPNYYPDATLISPPTRKYNCHSYAWYSQNSVTNSYWMPSPTQYYTDFSYEAVDTPRIGDIICYFDDNGTPNNLADDDNLHSGIVESINSIQLNNVCGTSSRVNVISKW